jgi:predicted ATPase
MIRLVEAKNYRCLKNISQPLENFQILIGPNGSGKSTFLDIFSFICDLLSEGIEKAVSSRTNNYKDLVWMCDAATFELAVEFSIPKHLQEQRIREGIEPYDTVRYAVEIGITANSDVISIVKESVILKNWNPNEVKGKNGLTSKKRNEKTIINKAKKDSYSHELKSGWNPYFKLGPDKSAFANLPNDKTLFPIAIWLKQTLTSKMILTIMLNSQSIKKASPPNQQKELKPDGSNFTWVMHDFKEKYPGLFKDWFEHLQIAFPYITDIKICIRDDDRHCYFKIIYNNGIELPSWMLSDGTLRLLALTLIGYLPVANQVYLIEEPENGLHPKAMELIFQSLSSIYDGQIIIASHSPIFLNIAKPSQLLCFSRDKEGATNITAGDKHPYLKNWNNSDIGVLFASGVLD